MRRFALAAVIALLAGACGGGITRNTDPQPLSETTTTVAPGQLDALASAMARWDAAAPDDYTVTQHQHCDDCPDEPRTVAVREGEIVSLAPGETETIEQVFTAIEESIRDGADVEVEYHPELGYPVRVVIDLDGDGTPDIDLEFGDLEAMPIVETLDELLEARRRWKAQGLDSYVYIFRADCTCPDGGTFEIEVQSGRVTKIRPLDEAAESSDLSPGTLDAAFQDLEQWFTDSSSLIADGLLAVDVRMDPEYGYPRWFRIEAADIDSDNFAGEFTIVVTVDLVAALDPVEVIPEPEPDPTAPDLRDLEAAQARWDAAAVAAYRYVVTVHCECPAETSGPFAIEVRNGEVTAAILLADGSDAVASAATIGEILDVIGLAILDGIDVEVTYDPILGYPTLVILDPEAVAVDGGVAFSITDFEVVR